MSKKKRRKPRVAAGGNGARPDGERIARAETKRAARVVVSNQVDAPDSPPFPGVLRSLLMGLRAAAGAPPLVAGALLLVGVLWLLLVAGGVQVFPSALSNSLALSPMGTVFDLTSADALFGLSGVGMAAVLVMTIARALVMGLIIGLIDEYLDSGSVSRLGVLRGIRAYPAVLLWSYLNAGIILILTTVIGPLLGQFGQVLLPAAMVGGLFLLAGAPIAAVRLGLPAREAVARATKIRKLPGWQRPLTLAAAYFFVSFLIFQIVDPARRLITANPTFVMWVFVLVATFVQLVFIGAFVAQWRAAEPFIPQQIKPRPAPARRRT